MNIGSILSKTPLEFADSMQHFNVDTGYVICEDRDVTGSNKLFNRLATEIAAMQDFAEHEAMFFRLDAEMECLYMVFVHSTWRGQAQGGTRLIYEGRIGDAIKDGMRLSKGMTDKNSVAQLWWGGGKAIICPLTQEAFTTIDEHKIENRKKIYLNTELRRKVFSNYGKFVASLGGIYVAAEDMNTNTTDMLSILSACRYVTCLPPQVGGSDNPSRWTAEGVFKAMLATVQHYEGQENLGGKIVNLQGLGNVGFPLAEMVLGSGASLNVFDTSSEAYVMLASYGSRVNAVSADEIYTTPADIFAPCARGAILNEATIAKLNCKYVVGAANNQLADFNNDHKLLEARGIAYLPDFFINRMGIVNCANEQYGRLEDDLRQETEQIYMDTLALLANCKSTGKAPQQVALEWAAERGKTTHPIWGHRGKKLLCAYVAGFHNW